MRLGGRLAIAIVGSALLHLFPIVIAVGLPALSLKSPVEFELLSPPPKPPAPPAPPAIPPGSATRHRRPTTGAGAAKRGPRKPIAGAATRPAAPPTPTAPTPSVPTIEELQPFAPQGSTIIAVLRADRLRRSPYRESVELLLSRLPDHYILLGGTGYAVADLDALLIATNDPFESTATFIAARHREDPKFQSALAHRTLRSHDPRTLRFPSATLSLVARPELLAPRDGGVASDDEMIRWVTGLEQFSTLTEIEGDPALIASVTEIDTFVRIVQTGLPTPRSIVLSATAESSPAIRIRLDFASDGEAHRFGAEWPRIVARWRDTTRFLGIAPLLDGLSTKERGKTLEVNGRIDASQASLVFTLVRAFLPPPPVAAPPPVTAPPPVAAPTPVAPPPRAAEPPPPVAAPPQADTSPAELRQPPVD